VETSECLVLWDDADGLVDLSGEMTSALVQSRVDIRSRAVIGQQFTQHHVARVQYEVVLRRMEDAEDFGKSLQGDAGVGNIVIVHPNDQGMLMAGTWTALPRTAQAQGFQLYDVPIVQHDASGAFGRLWRITAVNEVAPAQFADIIDIAPGTQVFVALIDAAPDTQIERNANAAGSRRINAGSRTIYSLPPFPNEQTVDIRVSAGAAGWVFQCAEVT